MTAAMLESKVTALNPFTICLSKTQEFGFGVNISESLTQVYKDVLQLFGWW